MKLLKVPRKIHITLQNIHITNIKQIFQWNKSTGLKAREKGGIGRPFAP